jgi:WD40 repeat protein
MAVSGDGLLVALAAPDSFFKKSLKPVPDNHPRLDTQRGGLQESMQLRVYELATGREKMDPVTQLPDIFSVAFRPDGQRILMDTGRGVEVVDTATGHRLRTLRGMGWDNLGTDHDVAFSPDGGQIAARSKDGQVTVCDATTGQETLSLRGPTGKVIRLLFSPDGRWIATVHYHTRSGPQRQEVGEVWLWDGETGEQKFLLQQDPGPLPSAVRIAFTPDGQRIALTSTGPSENSVGPSVHIFDVATGKRGVTFRINELNDIAALAFSRNGDAIAVLSEGAPTVFIYDVATGKRRRTLEGHKSPVCDIAFSPDGKRLASGDGSGTVKVWDLATGKEESWTRIEPTRIGGGEVWERITALAFSPDGQRLAVCGRGSGLLRMWNLDTGKVDKLESVPRNDRSAPCFAFSPDGQRLCAVDPTGRTSEWDVATGQPKYTPGVRLDPIALAYLPDGPRLAARGEDGSVYVQDAVSGKRKFSLRSKFVGPISSFAFTPDNKRIATRNGDKTVKVWELATGQELFTLPGPLGDVSRESFSPNGQLLALVADGIGKVFGAAKELATIKSSDFRFVHLAYSPDGALVARTEDGQVKVYNGVGHLTRSFEDPGIMDVAFSPDGRHMAIVSGRRARAGAQRVRLWDRRKQEGGPNESDERVIELTNESVIRVVFAGNTAHIITFGPAGLLVWDGSGQEGLSLSGGTGNCVAISPDGRYVATGGNANNVTVWDTLTGEGKSFQAGGGFWGTVQGVYFSLDSRRLVGDTQGNTVPVWDIQTGQEVFSVSHEASVNRAFLSLDGRRIVICRGDWTVSVWDASTGKELHSRKVSEVGAARLVAISPDGKYAALPGLDFVDIETGAKKFTLKGDPRKAWFLNFSPDGLRIATGEEDGTVRVWDARTGEEQLSFKAHTGAVLSVAFSWDGQRIVSGGTGKRDSRGITPGEVKIWSAVTGVEKLSLKGHAGPVVGVAFSRDDQRIVSGSRDALIVWEAPANAHVPQAPK